MADKVLVSVIITTYKREREIVERAIRSILAQTMKSFEIIVVDDNGKKTEEAAGIEGLCQELNDQRIRYICHESNKGACAARNTGIMACSAPYICFLDDDDEYDEDKLEVQSDILNRDAKAGWVICKCRALNDETGSVYVRRKTYSEGYILDEILADSHIATPNPLIRRECFDKVGVFDEQMPAAQDFELWTRIARAYPCRVTDRVLYTQHLHAGERITGNPKKKIAALELIIDKNMDYLKKHKRIYSNLKFYIAKRYIALKNWKEAKKCITAGAGLYPLNLIRFLPMSVYWYFKYGR